MKDKTGTIIGTGAPSCRGCNESEKCFRHERRSNKVEDRRKPKNPRPVSRPSGWSGTQR